MNINCPQCKSQATVIIAPFTKDERFDNPDNDFRIVCDQCSFVREKNFSFLNHCILMVLFLIPLSISWALFLVYSPVLGDGWIRFLIFLVHAAIGLTLGTKLCYRYAARIIVKSSTGPKDT